MRLERYRRRDRCANPRERFSRIFVAVCLLKRTFDLVQRVGVSLREFGLCVKIDVRLLKSSHCLRHLLFYCMEPLGPPLNLALGIGEVPLQLGDSRCVPLRWGGTH